MLVVEETQGEVLAAVPEPTSLDVEPFVVLKTPVIIAEETVNVFETEHPAEFLYVMVVVPADKQDTKPELETVATNGFEDIQGSIEAFVPDPVNATLDSEQPLNVPEIVGKATIVINLDIEHPLKFL
jgi:hypothetical protein